MTFVKNFKKDSILSISPFVLEKGNIILLSVPIGKDIRVCEGLEFEVYIKPYWVSFNIDVFDKNVLNTLKENSSYLAPFLTIGLENLSMNQLKNISGLDIRIVNMFISRVWNKVEFFEVNLAGLSTNSIKTLLNFLLSEIESSNMETAYLVVDPIIKLFSNPININKGNIQSIVNQYYR
nr:hypothetical protein [uncultured Carboxylicivirga sp.]